MLLKHLRVEALGGVAASAHLDMIRGTAALAVCVGHCRSLFFRDLGDLPSAGIGTKVLYFCTSLGHEAVVVFFVLSGFFISRQVLSWLKDSRFTWSSYLTHRLVRLYVVLLPSLLLTAVWDRLGLWRYPESSIYEGDKLGSAVATVDITPNMGLSTFFGNAVFLQEIFFKPFGSNTPLWSLSYEFWYYMIFPLIVAASSRSGAVAKAGSAALGIAIFTLLPQPIQFYFSIWCLGAIFNFLPRITYGRVISHLFSIVCLLVLFAGLVQDKLQLLSKDHFIGDLILAISMVPLVWHVLNCREPQSQLYGKCAHLLASFSYTLYLTHLPLLFFIRQVLVGEHLMSARWDLTAGSIAASALILAVVLLYAFGIAGVTEHRTDKLRRRLENSLLKDTGKT